MADSNDAFFSVKRRIPAPAEQLFAILTNPAQHPRFDGSGMLREAGPGSSITGVGDRFTMRMHNEEMGDYEITNHVVVYESNRRIGWEPSLSAASRTEDVGDIGSRLGHKWAFELTPDGPDATVVTETYDCSQAPEWLQRVVDGGNRWAEAMTTTLQRLEEQSR